VARRSLEEPVTGRRAGQGVRLRRTRGSLPPPPGADSPFAVIAGLPSSCHVSPSGQAAFPEQRQAPFGRTSPSGPGTTTHPRPGGDVRASGCSYKPACPRRQSLRSPLAVPSGEALSSGHRRPRPWQDAVHARRHPGHAESPSPGRRSREAMAGGGIRSAGQSGDADHVRCAKATTPPQVTGSRRSTSGSLSSRCAPQPKTLPGTSQAWGVPS